MTDLVTEEVNIDLVMKRFQLQNMEEIEESKEDKLDNKEELIRLARVEVLREILFPSVISRITECQIHEGRVKYEEVKKLIEDDSHSLVKRA